MATEDASLRQDLIENAVQHEVVPIDEAVSTEQSLDPSFAAELEHDLTIWPREYLETMSGLCTHAMRYGWLKLNPIAPVEEQFLKANLPDYAQYAKTVRSGMFHSRST